MKHKLLIFLMTYLAMAIVPAIAEADDDGYVYPGAASTDKAPAPAVAPAAASAADATTTETASTPLTVNNEFGFFHLGYSHMDTDANHDSNGAEAAIGYYRKGGYAKFAMTGQQNDYLNLKLDLSHMGGEPVCAGAICLRLDTSVSGQYAAGKGSDGTGEFNGRAAALPIYRMSVNGVEVGIGVGLQGGVFVSNRMTDNGDKIVMGGLGPSGLLTLDSKWINAQLAVDYLANLQSSSDNRTRGVTNIDLHLFNKIFQNDTVAMGLYGDLKGSVIAQNDGSKVVDDVTTAVKGRNGFDYTATVGYEVRFGAGRVK